MKYLLSILLLLPGLLPTSAFCQGASRVGQASDVRAVSEPSAVPGALPEQYQPQKDGARFNSNDPQIVPDIDEFARLKYQTPQWLQQFLKFPAQIELSRSLGTANSELRKKAADGIMQVVNPALMPEGFQSYLVPLSRWAVLYEDWRNHGGTDTFLTKFVKPPLVLQIAETHNHVVVLVRDVNNKRTTDFASMLNLTYEYADRVFNEHFKAVSADGLKIFRTNLNPAFVYGYYTPKLEALTGNSDSRDVLTTGLAANEKSESSRATAVRFFSNGDFAAFMVLKPLFGAKLKNPFEPRFQPLNIAKGADVPFWEKQAMAREARGSDEQIKRRQMEEFLGSYLFDEDGAKLSERVSLKDLERAYLDLSPPQRLAIVGKKRIDEHYTSGTKAFVARDYRNAIEHWTKMLNLDPENPRASILLNLAIKEFTRTSLRGDEEQARRDSRVLAAQEAIGAQQTRLSVKEKQQEQRLDRDRAVTDYRTRALSFLSEGSYEESFKEWQKLLDVDPGNPSALIFKDICEQKMREERIRREASAM